MTPTIKSNFAFTILTCTALTMGHGAYAQELETGCIDNEDIQTGSTLSKDTPTAVSSACFGGSRAMAILTNQPDLNTRRSAANASGIAVSQGVGDINNSEGFEGPLWVSISARRSELDGAELDQGIVTLGGDAIITNNSVFGIMVQTDYATQDGPSGNGFDANGIMAGGYAIYQTGDLSFDARIMTGASSNDVTDSSDTTEDVKSTRFLAAAQVSSFQDFSNGNLLIPHMSIGFMRDTMEEYVVNFTTVAENEIEYGQADLGATLLMPVTLGNTDGNIILGASGIFAFGKSAGDEVPDDIRARVDLGVEFFRADSWAVSAAVFNDGVGQDNFEAIGADIGLTLWF